MCAWIIQYLLFCLVVYCLQVSGRAVKEADLIAEDGKWGKSCDARQKKKKKKKKKKKFA
jgi:hypothetical protein